MAGLRIRVRGQVQGVGFRPFVWTLARRLDLTGEVLNDPEGVRIDLHGADLDGFLDALRAEAPPLSRITGVETAPLDGPAPDSFTIAASQGSGAETRVTPDAATCPACLDETRGDGRRRGYAFTNCTHCGPRFTILKGLPYDRAQTTMAPFRLCPACRSEYEDPSDRRFHAQPVACPDCGPRLWLEAEGREQPGDAMTEAARRLLRGQILAIKGLGGFHLACDATNADAIATLRIRKHRPTKPLALMGRLDQIRHHCEVRPEEETRLTDPAAPIVVLQTDGAPLPVGLAPGQTTLGWMLPYTPLHHLLMDAVERPLVMTSGNLSGEPQVIGNDEARQKLTGFADALLMHDREIARRMDDAVERVTPHGPMILRRARGRVPETLPLPPGFEGSPQIAAFGGQMKAALCLVKKGEALLSHHIGELNDALTWDAYQQADRDYAALFDHHPEVFVCDLHQDFRASQHAAARAGNGSLIRVQHHHAHLAACLAENLWPRDGGPVAGIILDGLGLGPDGTVWGGELLVGDYSGYTRAAHLTPAPLVGGDKAQSDPWRNLLMRADAAGLSGWADRVLADHPRDLLRQAAKAGINAPQSSSAGRLFDAVAAALGICSGRQSFEGEAGMTLEALAGRSEPADPYPFGRDGARIDPSPMLHALVRDLDAGMAPALIAWKFHAGLAMAFAAAARAELDAGRAKAVALSGGCFQNALLLDLCLGALKGLPVLIHTRVPANDGGLALGQALIAANACLTDR